VALAATGRPALVARVRDGVFGELAEAAGTEPAFADLDAGALSADLFALGTRPGLGHWAGLGSPYPCHTWGQVSSGGVSTVVPHCAYVEGVWPMPLWAASVPLAAVRRGVTVSAARWSSM